MKETLTSELVAHLLDRDLKEQMEAAPHDKIYMGYVLPGIELASLLKMLEISRATHFRDVGDKVVLYRHEQV